MNLHGQGRNSTRGEHGYAMVALLVALSIMAVMLTVAVPVWKTAVKREKESELVWRAGQYVRAITLFRRKYANAYPPNLDILLNEKFLRKKYKDPMTKDGEFQLLYAASPSDGSQPPPAGAARGGIIGVASKSTETSFRVINGRSKYNELQFTEQTVIGLRGAGAVANAPGGAGGNVPVTGAPGAVGQGGRGTGPGGGPGRGQINLDRFGRPQQPGQPPPGQPGQPPPQRPFGLPPRPPG